MRWGIKSEKESRVVRKSKPFDANCTRLKTNLAGGGNFHWTLDEQPNCRKRSDEKRNIV